MGASCGSNQREFGLGFEMNAINTGYLCSGAYDRHRDGDVRELGWAADLVNNGTAHPAKMLCPATACPMPE